MSVHVTRATMIGLAALAVAVPATAQQAPVEITFAVPLNLTRLPSGIPKVRVSCELHSQAIVQTAASSGTRGFRRSVELEIPVSQGDVVQTAQLVLTLQPQELDNPSGKQASYECVLRAYDPTTQSWKDFIEPGTTRFGPQMILTPAPAPITGAFVW